MARKRKVMMLLPLAVALLTTAPSGEDDQRNATIGPRPVTLTWDRTGNFGPHTPGTRTHGWQVRRASLQVPSSSFCAPVPRYTLALNTNSALQHVLP